MKEIFRNCEGFHWDKGNIEKNWIKHKVGAGKCEEVFFNIPFIVEHDIKHSTDEERYFALVFHAIYRYNIKAWRFISFMSFCRLQWSKVMCVSNRPRFLEDNGFPSLSLPVLS